MNIRRSRNATGVDGVESGHRYSIGLAESLTEISWAQASKDEILADENWAGLGAHGLPILCKEQSLKFRAEGGGAECC